MLTISTTYYFLILQRRAPEMYVASGIAFVDGRGLQVLHLALTLGINKPLI